MPATRQLAAIMFTDIVGYTALMGHDEQKALQLLEQNRGLQKPLIEQHGGQWIKELGDGVLASFSSAVDAVSCAGAINKACQNIEGLQLRIGIHLDDVLFENNDVFGDGVNIASRLQALAPMGGIWISEAVYKNISNRKDIQTRFVREEQLKHVKEPVAVYEIITNEAASTTLKRRPSFRRKKGKPTSFFIVAAFFLLLLAGVGYWTFSKTHTREFQSIAVLPFVNETGNTDLEYLSDGMTETLINSLSQLPDFTVKARSSVFRYKGEATNAETVGKELDVQAVLNGRIVQHGNTLTLYLELVDAATNNRIWGEQYNRQTADLVSLQSEIAQDVSRKLRLKLSGTDVQRLTKNYTANAEAYQLYLKGRFYWNKRSPKDIEKAIDYFQQAIGLDTNYALAYAGLSDAYALIPSGTPREEMTKEREAALKALSLDDNLAEAHTALARILTVYDYDFTAAGQECRRAIELNPAYAAAYQRYGEVLTYQGRFEKAFAQMQHALELEPLTLVFNSTYGVMLIFARHYDEALTQLKKTRDLDSTFLPTHDHLSLVYQLKGDYAQSVEERIKVLERISDAQLAALAWERYAREGWQGYLRFMASEGRRANTSLFRVATYYAALGEKDSAFAVLAQSYKNRDVLIAGLNVDPRLDPLRSDPRLKQLVQRVGFK